MVSINIGVKENERARRMEQFCRKVCGIVLWVKFWCVSFRMDKVEVFKGYVMRYCSICPYDGDEERKRALE